jgi:3-oxoacyl-[acyl-carrier protein] reductase
MTDDQDLTLVVTGATGGVGEDVARRLLERGDRLLLVARNEQRLVETSDRLGSDRIEIFAADVTAPDQAEAVAARAIERFDRIDGLVHLVGTFAARPVFMAEPDLYLDLFTSNVLSAAVMTRALLPRLNTPGYLVYISSLLAYQPMPARGPYAASKAALLAWAQSLSREVMSRGIHANVIVGALLDTKVSRELQPEGDHSHEVTPDAIADVVVFLTSPAARAIYGSAIPVLGTYVLEPPAAVMARAAAHAAAAGGPPGGGPPPGVGGPPGGP